MTLACVTLAKISINQKMVTNMRGLFCLILVPPTVRTYHMETCNSIVFTPWKYLPPMQEWISTTELRL